MRGIRIYASGKTEIIEDTMGALWSNVLEHASGVLLRRRYFKCSDIPASEEVGSLDAMKVALWVYIEQPEREHDEYCDRIDAQRGGTACAKVRM